MISFVKEYCLQACDGRVLYVPHLSDLRMCNALEFSEIRAVRCGA
jgi:hypothetical protein